MKVADRGDRATLADVLMHKIEHRWLQGAAHGAKALPRAVD